MNRGPNDPNSKIAVAIVCWVIFAFVAVLTITEQTAGLDRWGLLVLRNTATLELHGPEGLADAARDMTALGGYLVRHLVAILAVAFLIAVRQWQQALVLVATITSGWMLELALKDCFARPRPDVVPHLVKVYSDSFPSGHAFNAAVVFLSLGLTFAPLTDTPWQRRAILTAAFGISALVGMTRIVLGVHFPSDVLAGLAGGAGWAFLMFGMCDRRPSSGPSQSR